MKTWIAMAACVATLSTSTISLASPATSAPAVDHGTQLGNTIHGAFASLVIVEGVAALVRGTAGLFVPEMLVLGSVGWIVAGAVVLTIGVVLLKHVYTAMERADEARYEGNDARRNDPTRAASAPPEWTTSGPANVGLHH